MNLDKDKFIELINEGYSLSDLSKYFLVSASSIRRFLNKENLNTKFKQGDNQFSKARKNNKEIPKSINGPLKAKMEGIVYTFNHSDETKERLSIIACSRLQKHSKYSKNTEYKPGIVLESSYEVILAEILDELNIRWEKVRKGFIWKKDGIKNKRYIPDFYLEDFDLYLDPKNDFLIKKDLEKIKLACEINNIRVIIIPKEKLNKESIKTILGI